MGGRPGHVLALERNGVGEGFALLRGPLDDRRLRTKRITPFNRRNEAVAAPGDSENEAIPLRAVPEDAA